MKLLSMVQLLPHKIQMIPLCWFTVIFSGSNHMCCITVLYVTNLKSLQLKSSICSAYANVWLRLAVAVMDCTRL